jgi:hypothetical protein
MKKPLEQQIREARKEYIMHFKMIKTCYGVKGIKIDDPYIKYIKLLKKQVRELKKELRRFKDTLEVSGSPYLTINLDKFNNGTGKLGKIK